MNSYVQRYNGYGMERRDEGACDHKAVATYIKQLKLTFTHSFFHTT